MGRKCTEAAKCEDSSPVGSAIYCRKWRTYTLRFPRGVRVFGGCSPFCSQLVGEPARNQFHALLLEGSGQMLVPLQLLTAVPVILLMIASGTPSINSMVVAKWRRSWIL